MQKRVVHLINGLGLGGAETMLYQVLKYQTDLQLEYMVISLGETHFYEDQIKDLGIQIVEIQLKRKPISAIIRICKLLKRADTLCCWMYHSNIIGFVTGKLAGVRRIIWCIRHSNLESAANKKGTLKVNRICARLSRYVTAIAYNGEKARNAHEEIGYCKDKGAVLANGCDCRIFCPDQKASVSVRKEFGISTEKKIVLSVTRDHPIKDIPTFLEAFSNVHNDIPNTVAIMCGNGILKDNPHILALCNDFRLEIGRDIFLLGVRNDVQRIMASCNLFVLHSAGEAFPNVLIQAMACGAVCVTTDVGDARVILDDDRFVIVPHNVEKLKVLIEYVLNQGEEEQKTIKEKNTKRVLEKYDISRVVYDYENLF